MSNCDNGEPNFLHFHTLNNTFKINRFKQLLKNNDNLKLQCYNNSYSPLQLPQTSFACGFWNTSRTFHQTVIQCEIIETLLKNVGFFYCMITKLYDKYDNKIVWVNQLFNNNGALFTNQEFLQYCEIAVTHRWTLYSMLSHLVHVLHK